MDPKFVEEQRRIFEARLAAARRGQSEIVQRAEEILPGASAGFKRRLDVASTPEGRVKIRKRAEQNMPGATAEFDRRVERARRSPPEQPQEMSAQDSTALVPSLDDPYDLGNLDLPIWYATMRGDSLKMKASRKTNDSEKRQALAALVSFKECIDRCDVEKDQTNLRKELDILRDHIHKAEFLPSLDDCLLRRARILDGLKTVFTNDQTFPWDLRADAVQLFRRWARRVYSVDLLRGIVTSTANGSKRNADSIDKGMKCPSPKFNGHGSFVIGQWWPTQLCTVRDGIHGSAQGGIYGERDCGAYSIVLSGGYGYHDKDEGDTIWYSGTESKDDIPTDNTKRLIESADKFKLPIRVIRSWNQRRANQFRPERGFRYDGLYEIVDYRILDPTKAIYNFHLVRCPDQDPIRWEDTPSRRPTQWEIREYDRLKELGRWS